MEKKLQVHITYAKNYVKVMIFHMEESKRENPICSYVHMINQKRIFNSLHDHILQDYLFKTKTKEKPLINKLIKLVKKKVKLKPSEISRSAIFRYNDIEDFIANA